METGALGNHAELVHRALVDLLAGPATPAQMVRVRVALLELAGSGVAAMDEMLTAALADAADDDCLVATVLLQRARVALMESHPAVAGRHADRAVRLLRRAGRARRPGRRADGPRRRHPLDRHRRPRRPPRRGADAAGPARRRR